MKILRHSLIPIVLMLIFINTGCTNKEKKPVVEFISLQEADQKFLELCQRDFKEPVVVRRVPTTLWIYYPIREDLFKFQISAPSSQINDTRKILIDPLEVSFQEKTLQLDYGTTLSPRQLKSPGYGMNYSDLFQQIQLNFMALLKESYFNVDPDELSQTPQFIVIVIADIVTGIEFETVYYFNDLKFYLGPSPYITGEEYMKRTVSDSRGNKAIIGDATGEHLEYRNISMEEFLSRQIKNRINYKFTQSDFAPKDHIVQELIQITARTLNIYDYQNYYRGVFRNIDTDESIIIEQSDMIEQLPEDDRSRGKIHVINFFPGEQQESADPSR